MQCSPSGNNNSDKRGGRMIITVNGKARDATPEEIAEFERQQAEIPEPEPTAEERMEAQVLYTALMTDTLLEV